MLRLARQPWLVERSSATDNQFMLRLDYDHLLNKFVVRQAPVFDNRQSSENEKAETHQAPAFMCFSDYVYHACLRFFSALTIHIIMPVKTNGTLSHWPMSQVMFCSKSTCTFFRNSMQMREPKMIIRKTLNITPG